MRYRCFREYIYGPYDDTLDEAYDWVDCDDLEGAIVFARSMIASTGKAWVVVDMTEESADGVTRRGVWEPAMGETWRGRDFWAEMMLAFCGDRNPRNLIDGLDMILDYQQGRLAEAMSQPARTGLAAMRMEMLAQSLISKNQAQSLFNISTV